MKKQLLSLFALAPNIIFAAPENFGQLINLFLDLIYALVPVIVGLSFLVFLRGLALFVWSAGDTKKHDEGKNIMIWGIVGLFVMFSLWGILRFAYGDFGFTRSFGIPVLGR